jgi:hypothetical protein
MEVIYCLFYLLRLLVPLRKIETKEEEDEITLISYYKIDDESNLRG